MSSQDSFAEPEAVRAGSAPPPVIPLVHAPDDPGPNAETPAEPAPEGADTPPPDGWSRFARYSERNARRE
jgi:hypothetical protein